MGVPARLRRDSQIGGMIAGTGLRARVHLLVRNGKLRNGKAAPVPYCGHSRFEVWTGKKPIPVTWELRKQESAYLRAGFWIR